MSFSATTEEFESSPFREQPPPSAAYSKPCMCDRQHCTTTWHRKQVEISRDLSGTAKCVESKRTRRGNPVARGVSTASASRGRDVARYVSTESSQIWNEQHTRCWAWLCF